MRLNTGQHLKLDQRMKLAPKMIQSMEILQMSTQLLEQRVEQELSSNPTLELKEVEDDLKQAQEKTDQDTRDSLEGERELTVGDGPGEQDNKDDFERLANMAEEYKDSWEADLSDRSPQNTVKQDGERDAKIDAMANTTARTQSLSEQLLNQWHLVDNEPLVIQTGEFLVDFIDADGYMRTDLEDLTKQAHKLDDQQDLGQLFNKTLNIMQQALEPVGICARNLRECLLLQLNFRATQNPDQDYSVQIALVSEHLQNIEANRLPKIVKETGHSLEDIKQALLDLRHLDPRPGRQLCDEITSTISPDAVIEFNEREDRYVATLTKGRLPDVQISPRILHMIREKQLDKKDTEFLNTHLRNAQWLVEAIEQRENTLLRVIKVVLDAQRDYFDQGSQALKPLPMTLVADQLGIHVATVSRAVSQKYLQTPRGILPLRMFFSGGKETDDGKAVSWTAVQAKLKQVVDEEDKTKPLNDDQLVEILTQQGIEIARRTVAKYRKQLNIATARQRREY